MNKKYGEMTDADRILSEARAILDNPEKAVGNITISELLDLDDEDGDPDTSSEN